MAWGVELLLGGLVIFSAAFLAGVVGFAYALIALPLLLLVGLPLEQVVPINLSIGLMSRVLIMRLRWDDITWPRARRLAVASLPGAALGVCTAALVPTEQLQIAAGVTVLAAVTAVLGLEHRQRSRGEPPPSTAEPRSRCATEHLAGATGGFLGATTSLNGVVPALLMASRRTPARQVVADLAVYFVVGNACALALLAIAHRIVWTDVASFIVLWTPVALLGTHAGTWLGPRLPAVAFRRFTLLLIVASAIAGLLDGLLH